MHRALASQTPANVEFILRKNFAVRLGWGARPLGNLDLALSASARAATGSIDHQTGPSRGLQNAGTVENVHGPTGGLKFDL